MSAGESAGEPEFTPVIAWFAEMTTVNQFAAAANPRGWAEAQATGDKADMADELEARAKEWRAYLEAIALED